MMRMILLSLLIISAFAATGCDEIIVDWYPVDVYIEATDVDGNSIISPDMPGMTLTFKGVTYAVKGVENPNEEGTKYYLAIMNGLIAQPWKEVDGKTLYQLVFGEIDGAEDMDEDLVLDWPDGSRDVIHYHCSDHRKWPSIGCKRSWKLNGENHPGGIFRFYGKSLPAENTP